MATNLPLLPVTPASPNYLLDNSYAPPKGHYLRPYEPSLTESARAWLGDSLLGGGREGRRRAQKVTNVLELLPVTGDAAIVGDAKNAFQRGQNLEGGTLAALSTLGMIPIAGPLMTKSLKPLLKDSVRAITNQADDAASILSPKQLEKLEEASKNYPRFGEASKFMMPVELGPVLNAAYGPKKVEQLLKILPNAENFAAAAKMGSPKKGWYQASAQSIHDVFGNDAPRFASLLAATSPQNSVEMNMMNALSIWKNWTAAGRPKDKASIKEIMGASVTGDKGQDSVLDAWVNNTVRSLTSKDPIKTTLSGPKVDSFFRNLIGDVQRLTIDAHMATFGGINQGILRVSPTDMQLARGNPGMTPAYASMSALQRQAAERLGVAPANVQETVWSLTKPLMEKQAALNMPARDILQKGLLTPDDIRGTVDFATLMKEPTYANILESAGYGPKLDSLKSVRFGDDAPNLNPAEQNELMKIGARLENLADLRLREARAKQFQVGDVPRRAYVFQTEEAVPGPQTGHLPNLLDESTGKRLAYTGRASSALLDPQGLDIIHRNLGLKPLATRPMQGAYRSSPSADIRYEPGFAAGVEVPITAKRTIPKAVEQKLRTGATIRGALLAQEGSPASGLIPDPLGMDIAVTANKKLSPAQIKAYADKYGLEDTAIVDYGKGSGILNWTDTPPSLSQVEEIKGLLGAKDARIAKNIADPDRLYVDLTEEWSQSPGSGAVSQRLVDELNALSPAAYKKLNQKNVREAAAELNKIDLARAKKGDPIREDLINLRKIIAEKGFDGLKKAVKAKEFLPAIASLGLLDVFYQNLRSAQEDSKTPRQTPLLPSL